MKTIFSFCVLLLSSSLSWATGYYLSNAGDDNNSGTSPSSPWASITKLNTVTYAPGDTVFFKTGDVFRGQIIVNQGGTAAQPLVFTSYGSINMPVISGAEPVTGWTASGNIYQANFSLKATSFFVEGRNQILARYPNEHQYLTLDSASVNYLKDADLTGISASLINGSQVCVHTAQWCWEKSPVASYAGDKITYSNPLTLAAIAKFGYFLYDNIAHIDTAREWKYDSLAQILYYQPASGQNPNNLQCEAAVHRYGIELKGSASYVIVEGLRFENQANAGVLFGSSSNQYNLIRYCEFSGQYNHGVNDKGRHNEISESSFRDIDGIAVYVNGTGFHSTIHHNVFRSIGMYPNSGIGMQINLSAVKCAFVDSCWVHHNDIDSAGYCGIAADGGYHIVEKNIVRNVMLWNNDGAALKSYGVQTHHTIFRNNFVEASPGNTEGVFGSPFLTPGIYFDFNVNNCQIENNTVYHQPQRGIFQNAGDHDNLIRGNVIYHYSDYGIDLNGSALQPTTISGMNIKENVLFAGGTSGYAYRQVDFSNAFSFGPIDSNYAIQPYDANRCAYRIVNGSPSPMDFAAWQAAGNDLNGSEGFVSWTLPTDDSQLFMNPSDSVATVNLGTDLYLDLDSNEVCGTFSLQPWTSRVLINAHATCNPVGREDLKEDAFVVFPNPVVSDFRILFREGSGENLIRIWDASGRLIHEQTCRLRELEISAEHWAPGMYVLQCGAGSMRIVKQ